MDRIITVQSPADDLVRPRARIVGHHLIVCWTGAIARRRRQLTGGCDHHHAPNRSVGDLRRQSAEVENVMVMRAIPPNRRISNRGSGYSVCKGNVLDRTDDQPAGVSMSLKPTPENAGNDPSYTTSRERTSDTQLRLPLCKLSDNLVDRTTYQLTTRRSAGTARRLVR